MYHSLIARAFRVRRAYAKAHGRTPSFLRPRRFTEKMQWRKVFDFNPLFPTLCDKIAVREYVSARVGQEYVIPLLWSGSPEEIPFESVTRPFFLKSSHGSGQVVMIAVDEKIDIDALRARTKRWLALNHGNVHDEPGYGPVPPRLMIEETVVANDGGRPEELRLFVFDGKVAVINTVFVENGKIRNGAFHAPDWTRLNWHFSRAIDRAFPKPHRLADMIAVAERLGEGLDHVRVDIYDCGDRIWVGELTLYSWSGYSRFNPDEADFELGSYWKMPAPGWRSAIAGLFRSPNFRSRGDERGRAPGDEHGLAAKGAAP